MSIISNHTDHTENTANRSKGSSSADKKIEQFEKALFKAADKLRKNIDAAEYKNIVLGLIFLKYISDSFEELYNKINSKVGDYEYSDPEDEDEYKAGNIFYVPEKARWNYLHAQAKQATIGKDIDNAMEAIEQKNPVLRGILPIVYARSNLDKMTLGSLIDLITNQMSVSEIAMQSKDLLGKVYEYFLGEFANAEGKKGGQFYTPKSIVKLMVEMIEPYKGRVFDPACGSGGMFIMSEKFVEQHRGNINDISIYGQESNQTTYRLCRMNLAIRGIDSTQVKWNTEGSFLQDAHPDLKADFIIANPPFNDSDWSGALLQNDPRWQYGLPPIGNANFAWLQHMVYHLAPNGIMACVLANGSLSTQTNNEGEIRKKMIEAGIIDCIVALPKQLFYNTGIPACIWFISRKNGCASNSREGEILFIDASEMGHMEDRTHRAFADEDIAKVADIYHAWRKRENYKDELGFCKSATIDEVRQHNFVLTPGRYVGMKKVEDDGIPFAEKMTELTKKLSEQMAESRRLDEEIKQQLAKIGFTI